MDENFHETDPGPLDAGFADLFPPDEAVEPGEAATESGGEGPSPAAPGDIWGEQRPAAPQPDEKVAGELPAGRLSFGGAPQAPDAAEPHHIEAIEPPVKVSPGPEGPPAASEALSFPRGRVIAVVNQKGGVGKTTTTINLGAALALEGARVLLADFDPQGALSVGFGMNPNLMQTTVYNLLLDRSITLKDVLQKSSLEGLDLLPSNIDLSAAEIMLVSEVAREQMLKNALAAARQEYNYILIDCPPSLGLLTVNALTAADGVIIPLECEYFALRGMALLMDTIEKVQERLNPQLEIDGIVATIVDSRTLHGREVMSRVGEAFGDKLFKTVIHKTIRFAEAPVAGEPILTYAPQSNGAQEYRDLAREVISR